jgi:predicted ATPase
VLERAPSFASSPLPPLQLKGKRAPVEAFDVGGARSSPSPEHADAVELPFVGREIELAHLETRVNEARAGRGSSVRVVGPAGIGKTRLLRELRARAPELRYEHVTCEAYEISTPYASAARLLRGVLSLTPESSGADLCAAVARHAPVLEPWIPLLGAVLDLDIPDTPETAALAPQYRAARIATTAAALLAAAMPAPVLVVIDDAEWIDDASREVVETLAALAAETCILLASVAREDGTSNSGDVVLVGPLSRREVEHALRHATEHAPLRPHELVMLVTRAGGNPLFLTELWRAATTGEEADALPESIEALVTAQLDRLPPALRTILGYASVLGLRFDLAALRELAADEVLLDSETWSLLADFVELQPRDHARFRHGLIRDTAYGKLPFRRRRELHRRAAHAIQRLLGDAAHDEAELLSLHYFRADAYAETWHFARIAGERARARYAFVDAAALLDRAVVAARHLPDAPAAEVAAVREALGDVHDRNGEYERALLDYRATRKLLQGDAVREAELLLKEAWIPERIGRSADAVRAIRKGLRLVDGVSGAAAGRARAQLTVWFAAVRQSQGRRREAITWCNRALDEARQAGDRDAEAHALATLDWAYSDLGQFERANHLALAAELYAELGDLCGQGLVLNGQGAIAYFRGDWQEALSCYERARDAYERAGSAVDAARAAANIAEVLSDQGRGGEAESLLREALRVSTAAGYRYDIALIQGFLGRTCARSGRFDEAFHYLRATREALSDTGFEGDVAKIDAWLAETLCHSGDAAAALALADATLRIARAEGGISPEAPLLERVRAESLAYLGDLEGAANALTASIDAARSRGAQYELAITADALVRMPALRLHLDDVDALLAERDAVFDRLHVVLPRGSSPPRQRRPHPGSLDR